MGVGAEQATVAIEHGTGASWGEGAVFDAHVVPSQEFTQPVSVPLLSAHVEHPKADPVLPRQKQAQVGWSYRQILEIVAFPPPDAPHLWHERIAQLAADLGMPSGTTGKDVIMFVIKVAAMKNELDRVAPLVKAIGTAASVLEGRIIVPSEIKSAFINLYPSAARAYGLGLETTRNAVAVDLNTAGYYAEVSHHVCQSYSSTRIYAEIQYQVSHAPAPLSVSPINEGDAEEGATESEVEDGPTPKRPRSRVPEEDLYCRVGNCLKSFKTRRVCMNHRACHFEAAWKCPGPCGAMTPNLGKFMRDETLRRHLEFPRFARCREAVQQRLGLESISSSGGMEWMIPLRVGPERPWESHLTDLETVKARLRVASSSSPSAVPSIRSRRYR